MVTLRAFLCLCSMNLTWRDMQHLVVRTSRPGRLSAGDWKTNGVGRRGKDRLVQIKHGLILLQILSSWCRKRFSLFVFCREIYYLSRICICLFCVIHTSSLYQALSHSNLDPLLSSPALKPGLKPVKLWLVICDFDPWLNCQLLGKHQDKERQ